MIQWLKRNQKTTPKIPEAVSLEVTQNADIKPEGALARWRRGLSKTRDQFGSRIAQLFLGKKDIDEALLESLETILLQADLGLTMTETVLNDLKSDLTRQQVLDGEVVLSALKTRLEAYLSVVPPTSSNAASMRPKVIMMVGVNGAGKTTTIGKLAQRYLQQGQRVMLAAGDTFRAAAIEQLQVWGQKNNVPVIAQQSGADSASVIYDAFQAAKARGMDVLIADTAGRLHTQHHLMDELKKIKRVLQKIDPSAPHDIYLVLDASMGQNALIQARQFHEAMGVTGIIMTKLDGTAKGGVLFAIAHELGIPFCYVGMGEGVDDLRPFNPLECVEALFDEGS